MKAFAYLRVSGKGQIEGDGFVRQEQAIRNFAKAHGFEIAGLFKEGVSGTMDEADRPAFKEMLAEMLRDGVGTVIVEGMDRLAREYRIQESLLIFLASKGIELISARTEENVTKCIQDDPMKKALVQVQGIFSELEKSLLVRKLHVARMRKKASEGKCEGRKSYKEIAPQILGEISRMRRKRKGLKPLPFERIASALNERGYVNQSGSSFNGNSVRALWHRQRAGA